MQNVACDENNCKGCISPDEYVYHCTNCSCGVDLCVECILTYQLVMNNKNAQQGVLPLILMLNVKVA